jgi:hypothetical protein
VKKLLIILILPVILTGCLNYYQEVKLAIDGSGSMHIDYWMLLPDDESASVVSKIGIFTPDSIKKEFTSEHSIVENVMVYQDTTDSTTHAVLDLTFTHIDSLNNTKAFSDAQFSFKEGAAGHIVFSQFIPPIATGFGIDGSAYHVRYQYIFSGDIITHNAHNSSGRTLTWLYALSEIGGGKTISVTFRPFKLKETPIWIFILSGFVLMLVIFFLLRKKKS